MREVGNCMFESFDRNLKVVAERIKSTFKLLDSIQDKAVSAVDTFDIYSKVNNKLRTDVDKLYYTIQQCYDECLLYLGEHGVDIHEIERVPEKYQSAVKLAINPYWRVFQQAVNNTLKKYSKYLIKLEHDLVSELQAAIEMNTDDLLEIFNDMLKSTNEDDIDE